MKPLLLPGCPERELLDLNRLPEDRQPMLRRSDTSPDRTLVSAQLRWRAYLSAIEESLLEIAGVIGQAVVEFGVSFTDTFAHGLYECQLQLCSLRIAHL